MEGNYVANDLIWLNNEKNETEKLAIAYINKHANVRNTNVDK